MTSLKGKIHEPEMSQISWFHRNIQIAWYAVLLYVKFCLNFEISGAELEIKDRNISLQLLFKYDLNEIRLENSQKYQKLISFRES